MEVNRPSTTQAFRVNTITLDKLMALSHLEFLKSLDYSEFLPFSSLFLVAIETLLLCFQHSCYSMLQNFITLNCTKKSKLIHLETTELYSKLNTRITHTCTHAHCYCVLHPNGARNGRDFQE